MTHAIIRGKNGRRHEVDFGDSPVHLHVYASEETVEIFVEADVETHAEEQRRFAILTSLVSYSVKLRARRHDAQQKRRIADVLALGTKWIGTGTSVSSAIVIALDLRIVVELRGSYCRLSDGDPSR